MTAMYEKLAMPSSGLRLHLNENTGGCSTAVLDALRGITSEDAALYPDYTDATAAVARRLGVPDSHVLLTNGLDEGIFAAALTTLRGGAAADPFEAIVIVPGFDMFPGSSRRAGGRVVPVPLDKNFAFPLEAVRAAITARTRIVFITSPHNPTGLTVAADAILRIAQEHRDVLVFLDEAYIDFGGKTLVDAPVLDSHPNVVIGRTLSKAYGLAAIRAGALVATPEALGPLRDSVPPYSINIAAVRAIPAALGDLEHYAWYLSEVRESKRLAYAAFDRLGIEYWPSDANFVFARFGTRARDLVAGLHARGIYVRDRSSDPGCPGCVRMTTGVVAHTRACLAAIEEVLCGAR